MFLISELAKKQTTVTAEEFALLNIKYPIS